MIFASCFRAEYVYKFKKLENEKEALEAKVIDDYRMKVRKSNIPHGVHVIEDKLQELPPTKEERRAREEREINDMRRTLRNEMNSYFS